MNLLVLLQDMDPTSSVWNTLLDKGPLVILLAAAVWWQTRQNVKHDEKLEKYFAEDRKEMHTAIQNSTKAMQDNTCAMEEMKKVVESLIIGKNKL